MRPMVKPVALEGRELAAETRRSAIRQGFQDYQVFGWQKDPPYPAGDPRRWYWQNGADAAEAYHKGRATGDMTQVSGWR